MNFPDYIAKIARESALGAVNVTSSVIQDQLNQQQALSGLMIIQGIVNNADGSTTLLVQDSSGGNQVISYIGSGQIFIGQAIFVQDGYAQ